MYNASALVGNGNAAGVNLHDPQVPKAEHGNYLAETPFFGKKNTKKMKRIT